MIEQNKKIIEEKDQKLVPLANALLISH